MLVQEKSKVYVKKLMNLLHRFFGDAREDNHLKVSPMPGNRRKSDKRAKADKTINIHIVLVAL
jgi:hypothetical protein